MANEATASPRSRTRCRGQGNRRSCRVGLARAHQHLQAQLATRQGLWCRNRLRAGSRCLQAREWTRQGCTSNTARHPLKDESRPRIWNRPDQALATCQQTVAPRAYPSAGLGLPGRIRAAPESPPHRLLRLRRQFVRRRADSEPRNSSRSKESQRSREAPPRAAARPSCQESGLFPALQWSRASLPARPSCPTNHELSDHSGRLIDPPLEATKVRRKPTRNVGHRTGNAPQVACWLPLPKNFFTAAAAAARPMMSNFFEARSIAMSPLKRPVLAARLPTISAPTPYSASLSLPGR